MTHCSGRGGGSHLATWVPALLRLGWGPQLSGLCLGIIEVPAASRAACTPPASCAACSHPAAPLALPPASLTAAGRQPWCQAAAAIACCCRLQSCLALDVALFACCAALDGALGQPPHAPDRLQCRGRGMGFISPRGALGPGQAADTQAAVSTQWLVRHCELWPVRRSTSRCHQRVEQHQGPRADRLGNYYRSQQPWSGQQAARDGELAALRLHGPPPQRSAPGRSNGARRLQAHLHPQMLAARPPPATLGVARTRAAGEAAIALQWRGASLVDTKRDESAPSSN